MGDTLKLLREGDLIETLQTPPVRARIVIRERRYFSINLDGPPLESPVDLDDEGKKWVRLRARFDR